MNKTMSWMAVTLSVIASFGGMALAGQTDAPAPTNDSASAMWTLDDIYNKLDTRSNVTKRTTVMNEPTSGPGATMHTLNDIMTLVTNRAPVSRTAATNGVTGDDAWYATNGVGVAWPNPRFIIGTGTDGTNCVTDNLTGLMWARNANLASNTTWSGIMNPVGTCTWNMAFTVISSANTAHYGGYTDWRMPNIKELLSLIYYKGSTPALCNAAGTNSWTDNDPFTGAQYGTANTYYWSSTSAQFLNPGSVWVLTIRTGQPSWMVKTPTGANYVFLWPVRGGK